MTHSVLLKPLLQRQFTGLSPAHTPILLKNARPRQISSSVTRTSANVSCILFGLWESPRRLRLEREAARETKVACFSGALRPTRHCEGFLDAGLPLKKPNQTAEETKKNHNRCLSPAARGSNAHPPLRSVNRSGKTPAEPSCSS